MGAGIRLAYEAGMLGADAVLHKDTSAHEMQKLRDLRREINEAYRAEERSEALREAVIQAAGQLTPIEIRPMQTIEEGGKRSLLLAVGDIHYGAEWPRLKCRGLARGHELIRERKRVAAAPSAKRRTDAVWNPFPPCCHFGTMKGR